MTLPTWLHSNEFYATVIRRNGDSEDELSDSEHRRLVTPTESLNEGETRLIGSRFLTEPHEVHKVFLDIDVEHVYRPSRTPGHGHLMLNVNVTEAELVILMEILAKLGISGNGNHQQVIKYGQTFLRVGDSG